jgi:NDP-sugar pyrophosphorylase family protein
MGMKIHYSQEDTLLGTAGAARQLDWFFREDLQDDFVVVYGDVLTNLNLSRLIELHRCKAGEGHEAAAMTMALYRVPDPTQCGVVSLDQTGRVTRFVEKPAPDQVFTDLAFSGVMVCGSSILDAIPAGRVFDFGHDCIPALLADGAVMYGQPIAGDEFLVDIGTLEGYLAALSLRRYQIA